MVWFQSKVQLTMRHRQQTVDVGDKAGRHLIEYSLFREANHITSHAFLLLVEVHLHSEGQYLCTMSTRLNINHTQSTFHSEIQN